VTEEITPDEAVTVNVDEARVFFPTGSVTRVVTFTGYKVTGSIPSVPSGATGSVYSFSLSDLSAYRSGTATVTLPLPSGISDTSIYRSSDGGSTWQNMGGTADGPYVSANVPAFSYFVVVVSD